MQALVFRCCGHYCRNPARLLADPRIRPNENRRLLEQQNREPSPSLARPEAPCASSRPSPKPGPVLNPWPRSETSIINRLKRERRRTRAELQAGDETGATRPPASASSKPSLITSAKSLGGKNRASGKRRSRRSPTSFRPWPQTFSIRNQRSFSEGSQKELGTLLDPLREQIKEFRKKVEQAQTDSKTGVTKLETLIGTLGRLNQALTEEARNLTTALRGSAKAQGDWGEFILRDLLEKAGLREGEQYASSRSFAVEGEDGERAAPFAPT